MGSSHRFFIALCIIFAAGCSSSTPTGTTSGSSSATTSSGSSTGTSQSGSTSGSTGSTSSSGTSGSGSSTSSSGGSTGGPQITLIAGQPGGAGNADGVGNAARFAGISAVAYQDGLIYVLDNSTLREINPDGGAVTTLGPLSGNLLTADGTGSLYAGYTYGDSILRYDLASGATTPVPYLLSCGTPDGSSCGGRLYSIAPGPNGTLYGTMDRTGILAIDTASSGGALAKQIAPGFTLVANQLTSEPSTNQLFVGSAFNATQSSVTTVQVLDDGGSSLSTTSSSQYYGVDVGLTYDQSQYVYVSEAPRVYNDGGQTAMTAGDVIVQWDLRGQTSQILAGSLGNPGAIDDQGSVARLSPGALAYGDSNLYFADNYTTVRKVALPSAQVSTEAGLVSHAGWADGTGSSVQFNSPSGFASDGTGHLFVADGNNHVVRMIDLADDSVTTLAGTPMSPGTVDGTGSAARFKGPQGMAYASGVLYVGDYKSVRTVTVDGGAVSTVGALAGNTYGDAYVLALALGSQNNVYVGATKPSASGEIASMDLSSGAVTVLDSSSFLYPAGLAYDGNGTLYVADWNTNPSATGIYKFDIASDTSTLLVPLSRNGARIPTVSLLLDGAGHLIYPAGDGTIRKLELSSGQTTTLAGTPNVFGLHTGPLPGVLNGPYGLAQVGQDLFVADQSENVILDIH